MHCAYAPYSRGYCIAPLFCAGHQVGRPLFGVRYCGSPNEELLLSWGVDGVLCLWDSNATGYGVPLAMLISKPDYPIYSVDVLKTTFSTSPRETSPSEATTKDIARIAVAGGRDSGFLGMPFYLYDVTL